MLAVLKEAGNYVNWDEFLFALAMTQIETKSVPKYLIDGAKEDIDLRAEARATARMKKRYFPHEWKGKWKEGMKIKRDTREYLENRRKRKKKKTILLKDIYLHKFDKKGIKRPKKQSP